VRQLPLLFAVCGFAALNFYLWSCPITQMQLFLISIAEAVVAYPACFWLADRCQR
jgi:hypothetical protein